MQILDCNHFQNRHNPMAVKLTVIWFAFACAAANALSQGIAQPPSVETSVEKLLRFEWSSPAMGSTIDMVVYAANEPLAQKQIDSGLAEIERLSLILSNYDANSEISKLCASPKGLPTEVSDDLAAVLDHSRRWYRLSDGCFDITVGPITKLWRESRKQKRLPNPFDIDAAKQRCGWEYVQVDSARVSFQKSDMLLDLSGIAVGYIIDKAFAKMLDNGSKYVLINAGGDIRLGDAPPGSGGWRVTIAGLGKASPPIAKLNLSNCAITTSGDLNQYVEIDGRRYSHFVDPKTGSPIERRQSVTAIAANTVDADAGATALAVLGALRSQELFEQLPLMEAILVETDSQGLSPIRVRRLTKD